MAPLVELERSRGCPFEMVLGRRDPEHRQATVRPVDHPSAPTLDGRGLLVVGLARPGGDGDEGDITDLVDRRLGRRPAGLGWGRGRHRSRGRDRRTGHRRIVVEDLLLQLAQGRAGVDPQLLDQLTPEVGIGPQGVGLTAGSVEAEHQQAPQRLPERVLPGQLGGLGDHEVVAADLQGGDQAILGRGQAQALEPSPLPHREVAVDAVEGSALIGLEHHAQAVDPISGGDGGPGHPQLPLETMDVDRLDRELQGVAEVVSDDAVGSQLSAQPPDVLLHALGRAPGRRLAPEAVDELIDRDPAAGVDGERGEHGPLERWSAGQRAAVEERLDTAEQPDLQAPVWFPHV